MEKPYAEVTVLIVDDDEVDYMGMVRAFRKLKIANPIVRAKDGVDGLAALRDPGLVPRPNIVLLDLNMPRMNGIEFLEELRKDDQLSDTVVFVLTTSAADKDRVEAYHRHVAGYIVKEQVQHKFLEVVDMLDHYWRVVELPVTPRNLQ